MATETKKHSIPTNDEVMPEQYRNGFPSEKNGLHPIARILLMAVYDDDHIFSKLRGMRYLVKRIWEFALQFNKHYWYKFIDDKQIAFTNKWVYMSMKSMLKFPAPQDININMMPFIMNASFAETKLPEYLKGYHDIITVCLNQDLEQKDKICFLTVHESKVDKDKTQRRPGLHVETPGKVCICHELNNNDDDGDSEDDTDDDDADDLMVKGGGCRTRAHKMHPWGVGFWTTDVTDGIYMMTSVTGSCVGWNCKIVGRKREDVVCDDDDDFDTKDDGDDEEEEEEEEDIEAVGHLGDVEHLRESLPDDKRIIMEANNLYWLTDRTPHEAMPMEKKGYRQFFRLVTHKVGVWYEQHNTANPNGVIPDPYITRVVKMNKFEANKQKTKD